MPVSKRRLHLTPQLRYLLPRPMHRCIGTLHLPHVLSPYRGISPLPRTIIGLLMRAALHAVQCGFDLRRDMRMRIP